jgi:hypothetical protein
MPSQIQAFTHAIIPGVFGLSHFSGLAPAIDKDSGLNPSRIAFFRAIE